MEKLFSGVDIIEIARISQAVKHWGAHFLTRIYTDRELELFGNRTESLAARFAGKEAVMKALSPVAAAIAWKDIEILADKQGKPFIILYGPARARIEELGISELSISLSHTGNNAIALVIGLRER